MNAKSTTVTGDHQVADALRVALARLHRQLRAGASGALTASQASALARIDQHGPLRTGALAEWEGLSAATVSKIVDSLVDVDLVVRDVDPSDRRASLLRLSDRGATLLHEVRARGSALLEEALADLSNEQRRAIASALPALERLTDVLQDLARP